mmetsp:Transcript_7459/g.21219  ORF Transcript_7459/g.21219 Transcript_7459/m.21219 type:complete len:890 (+) Transcript_7459:56-2725(+)|eukprot:CAMPEP_0119129614 /NCGR_PEP_ID=MMETSP1310-20130426/7286_1 /TAXON_ID=464262 /ORGANISM="Genus nov. species nov., Strain RCC2339" /LENGTH=889 /DNA_ID=CAMNT_0007120047 /DNA_START=54 /DNA_END=2723 /DNA_ORIENTATION=-
MRLVLVLVMLVAICYTQQVSEAELAALEIFYKDTVGQYWTDNTNWLNGLDPCFPGKEWHGLYGKGGKACHDTIVSLRFISNNLSGTLPNVLNAFNDLEEFIIRDNGHLRTPIPKSIFKLRKLTVLELAFVSLEGTLSTEIGSVTTLEHLELTATASAGLKGTMPSEIANLVLLSYLSLASNDFSPPLPGFAGLTNLVTLNLNNAFKRRSGPSPFPDGICAMTVLEELVFETLHLEGEIPACLGSMSMLRILNINLNEFNGTIPDTLGQLTRLQYFQALANQLSGSIPDSFRTLHSLLVLDLGENFLTSTIPSYLTNTTLFPSLATLKLDANSLIGTIPEFCSQELIRLRLGYNHINGTVPESLCESIHMSELHLNNLNLTGSIPACLFEQVTSLRELHVDHNSLTGTISDLTRFSRLVNLFLNDNQLTGTLPRVHPNLELASLSRNSFHGEIPSEWGNEESLFISVAVGYNQLSGSIPPGLLALEGMTDFKVEYNNLSGVVPDTLCDVPFFDLRGNGELHCPLPGCCSYGKTDACSLGGCCEDRCVLAGTAEVRYAAGRAGVGLLTAGVTLVLVCVVLGAVRWTWGRRVKRQESMPHRVPAARSRRLQTPARTPARAPKSLRWYTGAIDPAGVVTLEGAGMASYRGMLVTVETYDVGDEEAMNRMRRRGTVLSRVSHPFIVSLYGVAYDPRRNVALMLVSDMPTTLEMFIPTLQYKRLKFSARIGFVGRIASALDHLHSKRIAHGHLDAGCVRVAGLDNVFVSGMEDAVFDESHERVMLAQRDDITALAFLTFHCITREGLEDPSALWTSSIRKHTMVFNLLRRAIDPTNPDPPTAANFADLLNSSTSTSTDDGVEGAVPIYAKKGIYNLSGLQGSVESEQESINSDLY